MPRGQIPQHVDVFDFCEWQALYFDGELVYWYDRPGGVAMLDLLGIAYESRELPAGVAGEASRHGWAPPDTLADLLTSDLEKREQAVRQRCRSALAELKEVVEAKRRLKPSSGPPPSAS